MDRSTPSLTGLFAQLGLPADELSIRRFIRDHELMADLALNQAPFWTQAQAEFLQESLMLDADWALVADELANALLARPARPH